MWSGANGSPKYTEKDLENLLKSKFLKVINLLVHEFSSFSQNRCSFPSQAKTVQVSDVSGGCGAMYEIVVESSEFQGISRVKQHQMITDTLKEEIKDMHGLRIHTAVPK